jgi:hypothetical protein
VSGGWRQALLLLTGSAHSQYEQAMPSGEEHRLRYVRPFERDEALRLCTRLLQQAGVEAVRLPGLAQMIYDQVGGIPRHIARAAAAVQRTATDAEAAAQLRSVSRSICLRFGDSIMREWSKLNPWQRSEYSSMLRQLVWTSTARDREGVAMPQFYDRGVLYVGADSHVHPVSRVAHEALQRFYFGNIVKEGPIDPKVRGGARARVAGVGVGSDVLPHTYSIRLTATGFRMSSSSG